MDKDQIIEKWLTRISNDYMHFDEKGKENARNYARICTIKEYEDKGVMMWGNIIDIDGLPKNVCMLFYVRPEYRGSNLFLTMIKNLENISIKDGVKEIIIGTSVSGYKEEKFNKIFSLLGYKSVGFTKRL